MEVEYLTKEEYDQAQSPYRVKVCSMSCVIRLCLTFALGAHAFFGGGHSSV